LNLSAHRVNGACHDVKHSFCFVEQPLVKLLSLN
jgi:hypothetical protein